MKLNLRLALITGGGRGIGRAVALNFAAEGASLVLVARNLEQVRSVAEEVKAASNIKALPLACDVSDPDQVEEIFARARDSFGREVDILVNNAGIAESELLVKTSDSMWRRHIDTNLGGAFFCMRAALPAMIQSNWGRIINIASIAGKTGAAYISAYSASKHGVLGLTRSAALEVAAKGITVNAICPGFVDTDMTVRGAANISARTGKTAEDAMDLLKRTSPQNRLVTPEEIAAVARLLASDEGRGINGQAINIDGGAVLF